MKPTQARRMRTKKEIIARVSIWDTEWYKARKQKTANRIARLEAEAAERRVPLELERQKRHQEHIKAATAKK